MVIKDRGCRKIVGKLVIAGSYLLAAGLFGNPASAMVTGQCVDCHTMHASQGGVENTEVHVDVSITAPTFAAWNPGGTALQGGDVPVTLQSRLLRTNCIGCHSSAGAATIVTTAGGIKVPIVYNTGIYPTATQLAGGNFWGVATAGGNNDSYGHNVGGISGTDGNLSIAPGGGGPAVGCAAGSCHDDLAGAPKPFVYSGDWYSKTTRDINGCEGCHNKVAHHDPADNTYRYLGGHGYVDRVDGGGLPLPATNNNLYEDPNWEQNPSATVHNFYKRQTDYNERDSIGRFCAGCHGAFHATGATIAMPMDPDFGELNGGDPNTDGVGGGGLIVANSTPISPWMRHPTNVNLPIGDAGGEYNQLVGLDYSPLIPLAQDPTGLWNKIDVGDQVMCLSCHRAHASDQPDALRFEYSAATMTAHPPAGGSLTNGCFFCHRTKDDP